MKENTWLERAALVSVVSWNGPVDVDESIDSLTFFFFFTLSFFFFFPHKKIQKKIEKGKERKKNVSHGRRLTDSRKTR